MNQSRTKRWYRRWWVILPAVLALLGIGLFAFKAYQEWQTDQALAQEIQSINDRETNWQFEDWENRLPVIDNTSNLALVAQQLESKLAVLPAYFEKLFSDIESYPAQALNQDQQNVLRTVLMDCAPLPAEIEDIRKRRTGAVSVPAYRAYDAIFGTSQISRLQMLRGVVNMLSYYTLLRTEEKNPQAVVAACLAILQLGHSCEHDLFVVNHLVCNSIQNLAAPLIERLLAQTTVPTALLHDLQAALLRESEADFSTTAIRGDRTAMDHFLYDLERGHYSNELNIFIDRKPAWRGNYTYQEMLQQFRSWVPGASPFGYVPTERLKSLRYYNALLERVGRQPAPTINELNSLAELHRKGSRAVTAFGASATRIYEADQKRRVMLRMAAALVAAERYRQEKGSVPAKWNDIVPGYFPAIPTDPYDGKSVRWKPTATGFILYSAGNNLIDDGGNIRSPGEGAAPLDVGVEFFQPPHRRQLARVIPLEDKVTIHLDQKEEFFASARRGDALRMKSLIEGGVDVNARTEYGATALFFAAEKGHLEAVKLLLENKIDLNAKDTFYSMDAVSFASMNDQHEAVALLLKGGARGEAMILSGAIATNKPKMAAAALASGRITQETLDSSLKKIDPEKTELIKLLTEAGAKGKPGEALADKTKTTTPAKTEDTPVPAVTVVEPSEKVKEPQSWPGFRGRGNAGVADGQFPPTSWDATTGKNLLWKTPIPGLGLSCPVTWENRLFITSAINTQTPKPSLRIGQYGDVDSVKEEVPHTWKTFCLSTETGKVLWERTAYVGVPKTKRHMKSSHANATPVTDGKYVIVNFGSEGLYCYSVEGQPIWKKELGKLGSSWFFNPEYEWGFGSSPVIYGDSVIVQCDIGKDSFIAAYLLTDGTLLWSTPREEIPSWCSPTLVQPVDRPAELVTVASKYARGYDPLTGKERWKLGKFSEIAVPTPFYAEGLIYLTTGYRPIQPIYAVKPGAIGDISLEAGKESNQFIVWSKSRGGPYLPTPLVYHQYLYVCNNAGVFSCYEAKTGKSVYQKRLGGNNGYTASLVAADERIYCTDEEGVVRVVKAGPEFQLLAVNKLGEECLSHPAISNGRIFFRGRESILALGVKRDPQ